ncbi:alpha/beta fold hydrolase [Aeromicrobium sp. Leaf350]|uniref:alpha/beta fold hydrolase n=1 Tax=Aeromicrobium sp. Leaf350 TaxID=2876565 RepID=UPI001E63E18D|nr:alpha/beta hydrolase [Aeromicrobium sp. Leaf350]
MEPEIVSIDGVEIATWTLGSDGPLPDVVLCHGTPWSAEVWREVAPRLARQRRVHLWDMPGYGRSTMRADVEVDLASQMERLPRLLEHWGLEAPDVVAHDIGGAVALGAHLQHGAEYRRLVLWDVVTLDPWGSPFFRLVAENAEVFAALPPALHGALVREYVDGAANHALPDAWVDRLAAPWITEQGQAAFYRQIAALTPDDTRPLVELLDSVRCPVRVGWGEDDPWIPVEQARRLAEALPGDVPVTTLPGVGHLAPVEAAQAVGNAVEAWLA